MKCEKEETICEEEEIICEKEEMICKKERGESWNRQNFKMNKKEIGR